RATTTMPSGVSWPFERSTRVTRSSRSRRAMWVETLDCTVCSERAAAEKLSWSATATSARSWRRSICRNDATYRGKLLDRSRAFVHNEGHNGLLDPPSSAHQLPETDSPRRELEA